MSKHKNAWRMPRCYYPTWQQSRSNPTHYTLLKKVFRLCVLEDLCVALNNITALVPVIANTRPASHHTRSHSQKETSVILRKYHNYILNYKQIIKPYIRCIGYSYYWLRLTTGWTVWGSNPGGARFSARPDWPWGPPSLLYIGYRVFPGGKVRLGRAVDHSPLLMPRSRKGRAIPLLTLEAI
jgi:hypothetical protein